MSGVKISPMHEGGPFAANGETLPMAEYAIRELNGYGLSHLLLMGATTDFTGTPLESLSGDGMFRHFRPIFQGTLIANVKMDAERGNRLIAEGLADLIAFGRPFIANPDSGRAPEARRAACRGRLEDGLRIRRRGIFRLPVARTRPTPHEGD